MKQKISFSRYALLTLAAFAYFIYLFLIETSVPGHSFTRPNFNLIAPQLLGLSALFYLTGRTKSASVSALIGLSIASRDIFSNWFLIGQIPPGMLMKYYSFICLSTAFLLFLFVVAIRSLFSAEVAASVDWPGKSPAGKITVFLLSILPLVLLMLATLAWLIAFGRC